MSLSYVEIDAWARLYNVDIRTDEVAMLNNLDTLFLQVARAKQQET